MTAIGRKSALRHGVEALTQESGGAIHVYVVRPVDAPDLILGATLGDREAASVLRAIEQAQAGITAAPKRRPMLCAACPAPLRGGEYSFVIAVPAKDNPHQGLGLAVCWRCGTDPATVHRRGIEALARIWPDLRELRITDPAGGRA